MFEICELTYNLSTFQSICSLCTRTLAFFRGLYRLLFHGFDHSGMCRCRRYLGHLLGWLLPFHKLFRSSQLLHYMTDIVQEYWSLCIHLLKIESKINLVTYMLLCCLHVAAVEARVKSTHVRISSTFSDRFWAKSSSTYRLWSLSTDIFSYWHIWKD